MAMMNPYPGLRPFRSSEAHLFYGREIAQSILETRVRVSPLTVLFARSGVGKSSFLTCRFLMELRREGNVHYANEWGTTPTDKIDTAFRTLSDAIDESDYEKPVLVLDQFEDIFKLDYDRESIWQCFCEWLNVENPPVHLLISMREEWLGALGEISEYIPGTFSTMVRLAPMSWRELTLAIVQPAAIEGTIQVDPGLPRRILTDLKKPNAFGMGKEYVEPGLVQLTCQQLWEAAKRRKSSTIDEILYSELGGADQICRYGIWRQLLNAGTQDAYFSELDRVLWVGISRHLSVIQGVKSIVSPSGLAKNLRTQDLGIAGPAVLDYELSPRERSYLDKGPATRSDPPKPLVGWISRVLNVGTSVGLLKCQKGTSEKEKLYELSHDSIDGFLQQFSIQFESWIRRRCVAMKYGGIATIVIIPVVMAGVLYFGIIETSLFLVGMAAYIAVLLGLHKVFALLGRLITFPTIRVLTKGDPLRSRGPFKGV